MRALHEYDAIRGTIADLDVVATRLLDDGALAVDEALALTAKLLQELSDYVDLQQLFVLPTIRRVDVWGSIRADALAGDHEMRRNALRELERMHHRPVDPPSLAGDLRTFVQSLRAGLAREERDVLSEEALRDDVVDTAPD